MDRTFAIFVISSLVLGAAGAGIAARWGGRMGLLDHPTERSSHRRPVPKGGGIGILAAFLAAAVLTNLAWWVWMPTAALSFVNLWGDRRETAPALRLAVQTASAVLLTAGMVLTGGPPLPFLPLPAACCIAVLFVVATANIFNFMDGIDGIAGISGIVGFVLLGAASCILHGESGELSFVWALAAAILGFLPFNFPRARVFMGDVASVLLGYLFAAAVLMTARSAAEALMFASFLFPFYADEAATVFIRLKDRENLMRPHRRHLYQILVNERGFPHWRVAVGYGILQGAVGFGAFFLVREGAVAMSFGLAGAAAVFAWFTLLLRRG